MDPEQTGPGDVVRSLRAEKLRLLAEYEQAVAEGDGNGYLRRAPLR